jgi:2-acylglycerol O-acyltransferase 2
MITGMMTPLATGYFQYDEILEQSYDEIQQELQTGIQRNFLLCLQPHGIIPFAGFCVNIMAPPYFKRTKTAVASILLWCPILKHLLGINGVISASKSSLSKHLKTPGIDGCVQIYVGGMAEVFKSSPLEERLFLSKRRGFIKLALRENVDIVPGYLFGNTSILTGYKNDFQARLSRKMGMTATYYFGKWLMPIPRDENLLYVRGKPMGLPHIPNPTQRDVDYWHVQYCLEVTRLFETYKDKLPNYKNKTLYID